MRTHTELLCHVQLALDAGGMLTVEDVKHRRRAAIRSRASRAASRCR
jgi:hypothetical protein